MIGVVDLSFEEGGWSEAWAEEARRWLGSEPFLANWDARWREWADQDSTP